MTAAEARVELFEIFSSVQGEGPHVGESTLFIRTARCDLRCAWCDSPRTWGPARACRIEEPPGSGTFREVANPLAPGLVLAEAERLGLAGHRMVSLTGGEPLLQASALAPLAAGLRARGPRVLLETHGLHAEALRVLLDHVDVVSMDWKLESDVRWGPGAGAGRASFEALHEAFLRLARAAPEVVVKVVVTPRSREPELDRVVERVAALAPEATLVLQPATPAGAVRSAPRPEVLLRALRRAEERLERVRLIPQTHPLLGVR